MQLGEQKVSTYMILHRRSRPVKRGELLLFAGGGKAFVVKAVRKNRPAPDSLKSGMAGVAEVDMKPGDSAWVLVRGHL